MRCLAFSAVALLLTLHGAARHPVPAAVWHRFPTGVGVRPVSNRSDNPAPPSAAPTTRPADVPERTEPRPRPPIERLSKSDRRDADVFSGFTGSAHDFYGPGAPLEVRCAPCHAPDVSPEPPPLWDRFRYARRRQAPPSPRRGLAESTILCLSCHDGTIASDIVGGGTDPDLFAHDASVLPRRDHPVGVAYPRTGRTRAAGRREYVSIAKLESEALIRLPNGRVECVSCHDPHNALGHPSMLVKSNRRSALCLSCHVK